ncbi:MAG TPA: HAMP domain-containing sensor histidine kinase [Myxococcaceae bacterium]|nr:HAMP domain-containing sensor histidine kinase [Myxococcaceae bacterium]
MLQAFIELNRDELVARASGKVASRPLESREPREIEYGVPVFLRQLVETFRREKTSSPFPPNEIGSTASKHGGELLGMGLTVAQVVHDYGDICQAITELAIERKVPISVEDFHTLNRCLDTAIAEAVTEHARLQNEASGREEVLRLGRLGHELRNQVHVAVLSLEALQRGAVGIGGSTGRVLARSVLGMRDLIDSTLAEVRLGAGMYRRDRLSLRGFVGEIAMAAQMHANSRSIELVVDSVDPELAITVDPQLLTSALMNLLHNAFKFTHLPGRVVLRTRGEPGHILIEVEDECGGLLDADDAFRPFGDRRGNDRSGLGLGLSISRRAVAANGGEIRTLNLPGKACIFTIDLPAPTAVASAAG